ncbi:hypothetical protein [Pseudonocardia nigra]|uniref:hypothetical protein n=1 Tax=Pseudonocardia nigra TaxID=1921578 RepID=UPI001C5E3D4B|nr:hypothetical protein [Pseudonocardia nigra]
MCTATLARAGGAFAVAAALLTGCSDDTAGHETGVSVANVHEDTESFDGEEVTVSAEVRRILSERAFVIGGVEGAEPLLVLHDGGIELAGESPVRVTGIVHRALDLDAVLGVADEPLARSIHETYGSEPYLEALDVARLEG